MNEKNIYFIADLHLFHKNIIEYENRPFNNLYNMHEQIIKNWNKKVSKQDKVFILGDLTFGNTDNSKDIIQKLNGKKYLIKGNHDKKPNQWYKNIGIDEVYEYPILLNKYFILTHEPMDYLKSPFINLHGHVHGSPNYNTFTKNSVCLSVERWNYEPISMFSLIKYCKKFEKYLDDSINEFKI